MNHKISQYNVCPRVFDIHGETDNSMDSTIYHPEDTCHGQAEEGVWPAFIMSQVSAFKMSNTITL
jgi:hypothetical protein